jgi:hypothetical protein
MARTSEESRKPGCKSEQPAPSPVFRAQKKSPSTENRTWTQGKVVVTVALAQRYFIGCCGDSETMTPLINFLISDGPKTSLGGNGLMAQMRIVLGCEKAYCRHCAATPRLLLVHCYIRS